MYKKKSINKKEKNIIEIQECWHNVLVFDPKYPMYKYG